jgi:hypothetical protein
MILDKIFERFIERTPVSVMVRVLLERTLNPEKLNEWYERTAVNQYTRELLFSSVFDLMHKVVFNVHPSINAVYQNTPWDEIGVSLSSVYNKINGIEARTSSELVRYSANAVLPIIQELGIAPKAWLPNYHVKLLDGNCIEASEHRIEELRSLSSATLPGKSLVVFDPVMGIVLDVFPCENGHAQERSLLWQVFSSVSENDLWICDRNFCVRHFLWGLHQRKGAFVIRQHQGLPWEALTPMKSMGRTETGKVFEQKIRVTNADGESLTLRRIRLHLDQATRDGEKEIYILTNLPGKTARAKRIAELYRRRWTIETAFQQLEKNLHSEINTLGYPKAALFGFCVALVAYNMMAVVLAAMRSVHGSDTVDHQVSSFYLAEEFSGIYRGMMIAVPPEEWEIFRQFSHQKIAELLKQITAKIKLATLRKHPRGPKIKMKKQLFDKKHPHVATAKLLAER